eukprot:TRINITY_DN3380_c0_g2_i1.p1 TRINITY_DN3380_c0_g2~~TRINITY_DN3380_c0_g2_i1.p1  ORF type:complete len:425 (-),score=101.84 TRINITY_DN3380_c0_g2_i1:24-1298(-)
MDKKSKDKDKLKSPRDKKDKEKDKDKKEKDKDKDKKSSDKNAKEVKEYNPFENLQSLDISTILVHADDQVEKTPDLAPPIHVATTFVEGNDEGYVYSRYTQPTRDRLEQVLSALEGGHALVYSSGSAAILAALYFYRPKNIYINKGYAGTISVIENYLGQQQDKDWFKRIKQLSPQVTSYESNDLLWIETPNNPTCEIEDIEMYTELAHKSKAFVVVDSTFATPIIQRPIIQFGVDMVMHSCTKFLSGQSDILGGALITNKEVDMIRLRSQRTSLGSIMGNLENFLLLRSLRTLEIRINRQVKNACEIAQFLEFHDKVSKVWHPSLKSHPGYKLCSKNMSSPPPILSFEVKNTRSAQILTKKLKLITPATSLGGIHSTIDWRYKFDDKVPPTLLRLSVGLEGKKDLIDDLKQALEYTTDDVDND